MIKDEIIKLLTSDIMEITTAAKEALELKSMLDAKSISQEEFNELIDDLVNLDKININMLLLETYLRIKQAFNIILTIKSLISII
jgi:hypothetical protein